MSIIKKVLGVLCIGIFLISIVSCSNKDIETSNGKSNEEKVIKVGTEGTTAGWSYTKDGNLEGYEIDIWNEIGRKIGYKIEFQQMKFSSLFALLDSGRIDSVTNQIGKNKEREDKYILSDVYAYNQVVLLTSKDSSLKSLEDIDGKSIASEPGTNDVDIVNDIEKKYKVKLKQVFYEGLSVKDVEIGRTDLWPRGIAAATLNVKEGLNLKILGNTPYVEQDIFPFPNNNRGKELESLVSKAIKELRDEGTLKKLSEKYFGVDISKEVRE